MLHEIDRPGSEPPIEDFDSDFIGATDPDLWGVVMSKKNRTEAAQVL